MAAKVFNIGDEVEVLYTKGLPLHFKRWDRARGRVYGLLFDQAGLLEGVKINLHEGHLISLPVWAAEKTGPAGAERAASALFDQHIASLGTEEKRLVFELIFDSIPEAEKSSFLAKSEIIDWYKQNEY